MRFILIFLASFWASQSPSAAAILTVCGASSGWSHFFEGGVVGPGRGGWFEDAITEGRILLSIEADEVDIFFQDATETLSSHRESGSDVAIISASAENGAYIVVAHNAGSGMLEHFLFKLDDFGQGTVVWGTVRTQGIVKSSLFSAACEPLGASQ